MTIEDVKKKYPPGTKYITVNSPSYPGEKEEIIQKDSVFESYGSWDRPSVCIKGTIGWIVYEGNWSKIITGEQPEYVEALENYDSYIVKGRIYKYEGMSGPHYRLNCNIKCGNYDPGASLYDNVSNFKPSTKEAYEAQNKPKVEPMEQILEEAKKKFLPGTVYHVAHLHKSKGDNYHDTILDSDVFFIEGKNIQIKGRNTKGGWCPCVYEVSRWAEIISKAEVKPSKVLIFNDIYVGDIVVSHKLTNKDVTERKEGDMFIVQSHSGPDCLYYKKDTSSSRSDNWRKATPEEVEAYNKGIRNIKDIVKTPQFVVGKWYKWQDGGDLFHLKISEIKGLDVYYSEYVQPKSKDVKWTKLIASYSSDFRAWKGESDLSEIQQYLPDGHIDKIKPMILEKEGYISGIDPVGNTIRLVKYYKREGDRFWYDYILSPEKREYFKLNNYSYIFKDARNLDKDEIKWLEACISANKFIPKEEALKPKSPELIPGKWYGFLWNGKDEVLGKVSTVDSTTLITSKGVWKWYNPPIRSQDGYSLKVMSNITLADMELVYKHFPEERPKQEVMENWCVLKTPDNKQHIITWGGNSVRSGGDQTSGGWSGNGQYYGMKNGHKDCYVSPWGTLLTTEQFYEKIGHKVEKPMENLVGRYLKATQNCLYGVIKGEYIKVLKDNNQYWYLEKGENYSKQKGGDYPYIFDNFELMPIGWTPDKQEKLMKYKIGQEVEFIGAISSVRQVPGSYTSDPEIPRELLEHGSTVFKENKGKIDNIYKEYYLVSYTDERGDLVRLGFKENQIQPRVSVMNTYGLKVGDVFTDPILNKWCSEGPNRFYGSDNLGWSVNVNQFEKSGSRERRILKLETIHGVGAMHLSDCAGDFYVRAEGFKEFMEEFNKPKTAELTSLPEKWCILRNYENAEIVNKWFKDNNYGAPYNHDMYIRLQNGKFLSTGNKPTDCIEITFEQFKKWVLKTAVKKHNKVNVKTQEQWDFVTQKVGHIWRDAKFSTYRERSIIYLYEITYGDIGNSWNEEYYSFEEWCKEFGHVFTPKKEEFKEGDWVTVLNTASYGNDGYKLIGKTFQIKEKPYKEGHYGIYVTGYKDQGFGYLLPLAEGGIYVKDLRKALPHEIPLEGQRCVILGYKSLPNTTTGNSSFNGTIGKPDVTIEEVARRYPIGTEYIPINLDKTPYREKEKATKAPRNLSISKEAYFEVGIGFCHVDGTWAEIIGSPKGKNSVITVDPHRKEVQLINKESDGRIDPSVKRTRSIKKKLTQQQEVVYF